LNLAFADEIYIVVAVVAVEIVEAIAVIEIIEDFNFVFVFESATDYIVVAFSAIYLEIFFFFFVVDY